MHRIASFFPLWGGGVKISPIKGYVINEQPLTKCLEALRGVRFLEGDLEAEVALRALWDSIEELRDLWELAGPKVFGFGSLDMPPAPAPGTAELTPDEELRLGWVQPLEVPMDRRDSILFF